MEAVAEPVDPVDMAAPLAKALVDALAELSDVARKGRADTGQYSYRYPKLPDVLDVVRPVLHAHGLAHLQLVGTEPVGNGVHVIVRTRIVHTSGATFTSPELRLMVPTTDAQKAGGAITYARRYSLMATLGIAGDDDDNDASSSPPAPVQRPVTTVGRGRSSPAANAGAKGRTPQEAKARQLVEDAPPEVRTEIRRAFREHFGVTLTNLDPDRHAEALSFVQEQLAVPDYPDDAPPPELVP